MTEVALFDARNHLSKLIDRLKAGEVFTITRRGKPVARLTLPEAEAAAITRGQDAVAQLRDSRQGVSLGSLRSRILISHGRR